MAKRKTLKRPRPVRARKKKAPARSAVEAALAGVVHDIRTPLTGIVALAELLAASDLGAREREWAAAIKSGADHLAVVADDAAQGVTDVVRGRDLFPATSVHRLLQALLGLPAPRYHHHHLILDAEGAKLSKSTSATGLRELRGRGATAADIRKAVRLD